MKNRLDLSEYAHVTVMLNLYDGQSGVNIAKKPYLKDHYDVANLVIDEWVELSKCLLELKRTAREMQERIEANELAEMPTPTFPSNVTKILSTKYMAKLNMFCAPTKQTYITLAIRPFILDKNSEPRLTKEGCTLNLKELNCLADSCFGIQNIISEQMSSTRFVALTDMGDVEREKKKMELFFQVATPGQKCRVIMEKKERQPTIADSAFASESPAVTLGGSIAVNSAATLSAAALASGPSATNFPGLSNGNLTEPNVRGLPSTLQFQPPLKIDEEAVMKG